MQQQRPRRYSALVRSPVGIDIAETKTGYVTHDAHRRRQENNDTLGPVRARFADPARCRAQTLRGGKRMERIIDLPRQARQSAADRARMLVAPAAARASGGLVDARLIALLDLRAAQINGCRLCVHHYALRARRAGVADDKIDGIETWRRTGLFSASEQAALGWAEHRAAPPRSPDAAAVGPDVSRHFSAAQMSALERYWDGSELWSAGDVLRGCAASDRSR
ncbi:carboxymuconolactone decarboxylase family protein [Burkholderia dolosa]|uniref:carboxymuconolactone decarboxylase family protein n=1 Tax=Burkholderia dolosa TaxID=152500 RepID=UPI001B9859A8|nr:carboxymuconolactone decarboxylase family protein [Burkholderia dolosa]MBR8303982.1 carboxymuconolactone decarboxylase family protein [Burkholderia dolosa]